MGTHFGRMHDGPSDSRQAGPHRPIRPALLGSPMRVPSRSPHAGPALHGSEMPHFSLDDDDVAAIQAAIEASLGDDMKRRLQTSLLSTEKELRSEYPDEVDEEDRGYKRARIRTASDLEEAVSVVPRPSPILASTEYSEMPPTLTISAPAIEEVPHAPDCPPAPLEFDGLLDHEMLLESIYASQGLDLRAQQDRAAVMLAEIGLRALDLGIRNVDEEGRELLNQCFYLSIARSYLGPNVEYSEVQRAALLLKRTIEACVLAAHPDWASDESQLGENAMAFADFLPVAMGAKDPPNLVSRLAIVIMDTTQGTAEVYLGPEYLPPEESSSREDQEKNLILLCYTPGHYKALVLDDYTGSKPEWTYSEFKETLDQRGIFYIETCDFD